jgi:hypothetical protein
LQASGEIILIHAFERTPQFGGGRGLSGRQLARRTAYLLGEARQIVSHLLAILDQLVDFLGRRILLRLARRASGILLRDQIANLIGSLFLLGRQLLGGLCHRIETTRGVLLLLAAQQIGSFAQTVGRPARVGRIGPLGSGAAHVFVGLAQAVERLLGRLLPVVGLLLRGLLRIARLSTALTRLSIGLSAGLPARLPGLSRS